MFIRMLQSRLGTEDGFAVALYEQGAVLEVAESLGCYFVRRGWAAVIQSEAKDPGQLPS